MANKERLGVLDGLRGIAILQVLWFHVWLIGRLAAPPWLQFIPQTGYFGVHLFFFISGFVIVYPFVRAQYAREPEPTWTHFVWRRFIKIVPSYVLSIAAAYAVGFAAVERTNSTVPQELITHALFIHTWWPGTAGSINGVLWTLAIEVQFYAIFPLAWWCFKRQPWFTGLGLIAFALAFRTWHGQYVPAGNLPSYIDLFAFGMLTAWCFVHFGARLRDGRGRYFMPVLACAGAVMMAVTFISYARVQGPSSGVREYLGIAFSLLAFGVLCAPRQWSAVLSNWPLRFFAIISYNLYLWNWMIAHEVYKLHLPLVAFTVTAVVVSIAVATLITYLMERPLLRMRAPERRTRALKAPA